jgi:hypothetical protein
MGSTKKHIIIKSRDDRPTKDYENQPKRAGSNKEGIDQLLNEWE